MAMGDTKRKRMVVEEVGASEETPVDQPTTVEPVGEIKQKVEELQDITEDLSESVAKSEDVQEELAKAVEEAAPTPVAETPVEEHEQNKEPEAKMAEPPQELIMSDTKDGGTNPLFVIIPGIFLLGALLGGIYFYQKGTVGTTSPSPTPELTTDNAPAPSSTPSSTLDLAKYPINIMNGSGTPGEAGKVKTILTTGGFNVSATGNASSYNFTKTVIKAQADVPAAFVTQLSTLLGKAYVLDTNQPLATSSADKVQVIVGSTKAQ